MAGIIAGGFLTNSPTLVSGLGLFWLQAPLASAFVTALPSQEHARLDLVIPADPALAGLQLGFQALTLPSAATPSLTEAASLYVL